MAKIVPSWYGLSPDERKVILRGTDTEVSRFRNRCHEFVRSLNARKHRTCFPNMVAPGRYGSCAKLADWKRFLQENYSFRCGEDRRVYLVRLSDGKRTQVCGPGLE